MPRPFGHRRSGRRGWGAADETSVRITSYNVCYTKLLRHQPVGDAPVVGALAHGVDARIVGLQGVVDHDAAVAIDAGRFGQRRVSYNFV